MKPQEARLAYLMVTSPIPNIYIGGVMVVDGRGLPIEFRYSEPIQPTKIQQILYGNALSRYIKTEVILESLLKSLDCKPHILIVNDDSFLFKDAGGKDLDVVRLTETKSGPLKAVGQVERMNANDFLLQLTPESSPLRVQLQGEQVEGNTGDALKSLPDKSSTTGDPFEGTRAYQVLFEVGRICDLLEPMKRVEKALAALCQEAGAKNSAAS